MNVEGLIHACSATDIASDRIQEALEILIQYGQVDGAHHKTWVIDQAVRALAGPLYDELIREANAKDDSDWKTGTPP